MTRFTVPAEPDAYGLPARPARRRRAAGSRPARCRRPRPTSSRTSRRTPPPSTPSATTPSGYLVDRVARTTTLRGGQRRAADRARAARRRPRRRSAARVTLRVIGHGRTPSTTATRSSGCRSDSSATTGWPPAPRRWRSPTHFLDDLFDPGDPRAVSPRPPYLVPGRAGLDRASTPTEFRALLPELRRLRPPRRRRRPGVTGRLLDPDRPPPLRRAPRPRPSRPGAARAAGRLARPVRRLDRHRATTRTTCSRSRRPTRPG